MKTLILYYSYSGKTKAIAEELAKNESADIEEVKDVKRPVKLKAYTAGILASIRGKAWKIQPLSLNMNDYDRLILLSPVWASNPPPAVNALLELLPVDKTVSVKMISQSGKSECKERLETIFKDKGCTLESFKDLQS